LSIFTAIDHANWVAYNDLAFAIYDGFPVAPGHTLIIPKREIPDWFAATEEERVAIFELVDRVKVLLDREFKPEGYNIGMNCGEAAGQTVMHLHVHVIPRYAGDMADPRGGVRHVIPWKGNYKLQRASPLATGGEDAFLKHLNPLFARATQIDILAAFVQDSGIALIESRLLSAVERDAEVRILCSDYLHITQEAAVRRLFDLQSTSNGRIHVRIARSWVASFHPKSWQFVTPSGGAVFVGSSNLSYAALNDGIEWNLRVDQHSDPVAFAAARDAYEYTWGLAEVLTPEFVADYRQRLATTETFDLPPGEMCIEPSQPVPRPHSIQERMLEGLAQAREEGHRRALAVMATGLGKTWLAAFDVHQFSPDKMPRVLFVAHRVEILNQAANTFRKLYPNATFSWFAGTQGLLDGDFVFASIQKLARADALERIASEHFDYVIIDEVHHAAADSYQKLLRILDPGFLLGLTATPDRADGADILSLFNDYVVDDVGIMEGIGIGRLVPFHYTGIADTVDYAPIPWRSGRFESEQLSTATETAERMERLWEVIHGEPRLKTIAFCCTIQHAVFVRDWFLQMGLRVAAIVSGNRGDDREESLRRLADGELDIVCAVDILNEGVDIPAVDRVLFLRPTESKVVFLQQLGRGLRVSPRKTHLEVVDFVGNHSIFVERMQWMLTLQDPASKFSKLLEDGGADLPEGCSIKLDFEAKDILKELTKSREKNPLVAAYRHLKRVYGIRPSATAMFREGHNLNSLKSRGGWAGLVHQESDSGLPEHVFLSVVEWFQELEKTSMTKSFKMVCLLAMIEENAVFTGLNQEVLATRSLTIIRRSPELMEDLQNVEMLGQDGKFSAEVWLQYWRKNPLAAWSNSKFVKVSEGRFEIIWPADIQGDRSAILKITTELVEYRIASYKARKRNMFFARVTHSGSNPILMLQRKDGVPTGEQIIRLEDGVEWVFRFAKIAVNVAHPQHDDKNRLADLLRAWFGSQAGENGTRQRVRFEQANGQWFARPVGITPKTLEDFDDDVDAYLTTLTTHMDFHRKIIAAMVMFRNASKDEVDDYLVGVSARS